jgi:hypothetical protein
MSDALILASCGKGGGAGRQAAVACMLYLHPLQAAPANLQSADSNRESVLCKLHARRASTLPVAHRVTPFL